LYGQVHTIRRQLNLDSIGSDVKYKSKRAGATAAVADPHARRAIKARLHLLEPLDTEIPASNATSTWQRRSWRTCHDVRTPS
jgi:hypothetical protein